MIFRNESSFLFQIYQIDSAPLVLVINNKKFDGNYHDERSGSEKDVDAVLKTFVEGRPFHFKLFEDKSHEDLTLSEMKDIIKRFTASQASFVMVFIMSHGTTHNIISFDNQNLKRDWIRDAFSNNEARTLIGKPKLLILQACRYVTFKCN
jgi:hypothetical protein